MLGLLGLALGLQACTGPTEPDTGGTPPPTGRLEILPTVIQRLPEMDFVVQSSNPTRDGWPTSGQQVTWRAHVRSLGNEAEDVPYAWTLDGDTVDTGHISIPADSTATVDYPWTWTFGRHELSFVVDSGNTIQEENEENNTLTVYTDALSVGFWVEQSFYNLYRDHIHEAASTLSSFEDWAQFHINRMNQLFASARYAETSDGVLDRVRLDKIVVVPDGTINSSRPAPDDHSVDLEWGFEASEVAGLSQGPNGTGYSPTFGYRPSLIHELGHARYLIDVYLWDLIDGFHGTKIDIQEGGQPLVGSRYMPVLTKGLNNGTDTAYTVLRTPEQGLMNTDYTRIDRYSAIALNLIAHQRPRYENVNCPTNCGQFMTDMPTENVLDLQDTAGDALAGASVRVYRSDQQPFDPFDPTPPVGNYFDDTPDLVGTADAAGGFDVGRNPFGEEYPGAPFPLVRRHIIVRVAYQGKVGYAIVESRIFNLAYWHGDTQVAHHPVAVKLFDPTS